MRIAVLAPVATPVPPAPYGGAEAVVGALADGLIDAGHDVTLFATGDSETKATLVAPLEEPPTRPGRRTNAEVHHVLTCLRRADEFDVVSSHLGVLGAAVSNGGAPPFVHTVSDPIDRTANTWRLAAATAPTCDSSRSRDGSRSSRQTCLGSRTVTTACRWSAIPFAARPAITSPSSDG